MGVARAAQRPPVRQIAPGPDLSVRGTQCQKWCIPPRRKDLPASPGILLPTPSFPLEWGHTGVHSPLSSRNPAGLQRELISGVLPSFFKKAFSNFLLEIIIVTERYSKIHR